MEGHLAAVPPSGSGHRIHLRIAAALTALTIVYMPASTQASPSQQHGSAGASSSLGAGVVFEDAGLSWRVAFNGYGNVARGEGSAVRRITLAPARPASSADTHSALVLSRRAWRDLTATIRIRTNKQLRTPHPNAWEVGWVLWHYIDDQHFYYVILKPDGWELGKEDPTYVGKQQFLATGTHPVFPTGRWYTVTVEQRRDVITVLVGNRRVVRLTDDESPYKRGQVGLYTEDSSSTFEPLAIRAANDW